MRQDKNILVTGGAGFIGSHLIKYLLANYENYNIINLDALTYASDIKRLSNIADHQYCRYRFISGNIGDQRLVETIFKEHQIQEIFHLAAESHVDNSKKNPPRSPNIST